MPPGRSSIPPPPPPNSVLELDGMMKQFTAETEHLPPTPFPACWFGSSSSSSSSLLQSPLSDRDMTEVVVSGLIRKVESLTSKHSERLKFLDPELEATHSRIEVLEALCQANSSKIDHLEVVQQGLGRRQPADIGGRASQKVTTIKEVSLIQSKRTERTQERMMCVDGGGGTPVGQGGPPPPPPPPRPERHSAPKKSSRRFNPFTHRLQQHHRQDDDDDSVAAHDQQQPRLPPSQPCTGETAQTPWSPPKTRSSSCKPCPSLSMCCKDRTSGTPTNLLACWERHQQQGHGDGDGSSSTSGAGDWIAELGHVPSSVCADDCAKMADELWRHALNTLDYYREEAGDINHLYQHDDPTGILNKHRKMVSNTKAKIEPKAMYFELIKMLTDYERAHCKPEAYLQVKEVSKIQGYQDLTNRLLRNINERLVRELQGVTSKLDRLEKAIGLISKEGDEVDSAAPAVTLGQRMGQIEGALNSLGDRFLTLEGHTNRHGEDISMLHDRMKSRDELESDVKSVQEEQARIQTEALAVLERRIDSNEDHIELLEKHDSDQDEALTALKTSTIPNLEHKLQTLEAADTFLQEAHKLAMEKAENIEIAAKTNLDRLEKDLIEFRDLRDAAEEKTSNMLHNLAENEAQLAKAVEGLNKENGHIKGKLEELNSNTTQLEEKAMDLLGELEKAKQVSKDLETEQSNGVAEANKRVDQLDGLLNRLMAEDLETIRNMSNNNANDIKVLSDVSANHGDRLHKAEAEIDSIWSSVGMNKTEAEAKIKELDDELGQIAKQIKEEISKVTKQAESEKELSEERLRKLETSVQRNAEEIEDGKVIMKSNNEHLRNVDTVAQENKARSYTVAENLALALQKIEELQGIDEKQQQDLDKLRGSHQSSLKDLEERSMDQLARIVGLEEQAVNQQEKASYVERLQTKLHAMDEQKQQSEAKIKEEMDNTALQNKKTLEELKAFVEEEVGILRDKASHNHDQIGDLREANKVVETGLKTLTDGEEELQASLNALKDNLGKAQGHNKDLWEGLQNDLRALEQNNSNLRDQVSNFLAPTAEHNAESIRKLEELLENSVPIQIKERVASALEGMMEERVYPRLGEMADLKVDCLKHVDNLRELNSKLMEQVREEGNLQKEALSHLKEENINEFNNLHEKIHGIVDALSAFNKDEFDDLLSSKNAMDGKLGELELDIKDGKEQLRQTHNTLNAAIIESKNENSKAVACIDEKLTAALMQLQGQELANLKSDLDSAQASYVNQMESVQSLIQNVQINIGEVKNEYEEGDRISREMIKKLREHVEENKADIWTIVLEVYGALKGSALVLKSTGPAAKHQQACLGVYRIVDHVCGRPVYKQDGGENYIYYNDQNHCWLIGSCVGETYAWIRKDSQGQSSEDSDSSSQGSDGEGGGSTRKQEGRRFRKKRGIRTTTTDLLKSGWKYKPMALELCEAPGDCDDPRVWMSDDSTLRVEALRGTILVWATPMKTVSDLQQAAAKPKGTRSSLGFPVLWFLSGCLLLLFSPVALLFCWWMISPGSRRCSPYYSTSLQCGEGWQWLQLHWTDGPPAM